MDDNAGIAEMRDRAVAQIARPFRGAAREDHHVALGEPLIDEARQHDLVVGADPQRHRHATRLLDRRSEDRRVRIIDRARPDRLSRGDDLVAGRDDRHSRPAPHLDGGNADRRDHADFARGQHLAGAQYGLATGQIAAGKGDELTGCGRAAHLDHGSAIGIPGLGVLNHDYGVGAARHHASGGDQGGHAGHDGETRLGARRQDLGVEREGLGRAFAGRDRIVGTHREAVDTGSVEAWDIDIGDERARQHPPQRLRQRHRLAGERPQFEMAMKARYRLVATDHIEKLLLSRQAA